MLPMRARMARVHRRSTMGNERAMARWREQPLLVAGVDEAGRGPLAGPVVAAAVILGDRVPDGLADSKRLSPAKRERLFGEIMTHATAVGFRIVSARRIDRADILRATLAAMREAVLALPVAPRKVYVDGRQIIPGLAVDQEAVVGGDALYPAISAASIVAKVVRDRIMDAWDRAYPEYGFAQHKGYGTRRHVSALIQWGPCSLHRRTFAPVRQLILKQETEGSLSK